MAGSTPLTAFSPSPTTWTWSPRIDELTATPGAFAAASPAPIGTASQPLCEVITWLVPSCLRSAVSSLASRPLPKTATNETSVSPIISAAAVEAVRPGLRIAFSCASRPAAPPSRAAGRPTTWASGRTSRGAITARPMKMPKAPPAMPRMRIAVETSEPSVP